MVYTYGSGIDQPLGVIRIGYADWTNNTGAQVGSQARHLDPFALFPLWTSRGQAELGTFDDGRTLRCQVQIPTTEERCVKVTWPGTFFVLERSKVRNSGWHGTLLEDKRDDAGTYYRRNRYYDPATNRFTQEDPIGLAGGLNAYGFADGDPVGYSDPYGLSAEDCCQDNQNPRNLELEVKRAQNVTRGEFIGALGVLSGAVGFMLPEIGAALLARFGPKTVTTVAAGGGVAATASRTAARMERPPLPDGMSNAQFGELLNWGRGSEAARAQIGNLSAATIRAAGVTRSMAQAWQQFYEYEAQAVRTNPSAAGRADLMRHVADLLKH